MSRIEKEAKSPAAPHPRMRPSHALALFLLVATVGLGLMAAYGFYVAHWRHGVARELAGIVPLPAASVDGSIILYRDVIEMAELIEYSANGQDIGDPWDQALSLLIEKKQIEGLAQSLGVSVAPEEIDGFSLDEQEVSELQSAIGWSEANYRYYIVRPLLYAQKTEGAVMAQAEYQKEARGRMEDVQEKINAGISFDDLARQFSEDISAADAGLLGYVTAGELDPGLEPLFELGPGEISEILETPRYFAIGYVYDVVPGDSGEGQIGVQLITIKKDGLSVALAQYAPSSTVRIYAR